MEKEKDMEEESWLELIPRQGEKSARQRRKQTTSCVCKAACIKLAVKLFSTQKKRKEKWVFPIPVELQSLTNESFRRETVWPRYVRKYVPHAMILEA